VLSTLNAILVFCPRSSAISVVATLLGGVCMLALVGNQRALFGQAVPAAEAGPVATVRTDTTDDDTTDTTAADTTAADTTAASVPTDTIDVPSTPVDTAEAVDRTATDRDPPDPSLQDADRLQAPSDTLRTAADTSDTADAIASREARPDTVWADSGRVPQYLPQRSLRPRRVDLFERRPSFLSPRSEDDPTRRVALDSTGFDYRMDGGSQWDGAMRLGADTYREERFRANLRDNWTQVAEQRQRQDDSRGGVGVNVVVPGGRQSAFSTIFGKPEVDLRVNGQADINAGFEFRKSDQQAAITGDAGQFSPNFKQDLRLGVTGTIGDKMKIDVDWDTQNQFEYQNQVKLKYTGYDDEIVQSVEAGNVFLETSSQLVNGGQSLFGIKSEFKLGNLNLTTIASQQEGQSNSLSIEGGSEKTEFDLKATDYDDNTHFFLGYFFRNSWEEALSDPPTVQLQEGFSKISEIEVWKLQTSRTSDDASTRRAVAVVDLGEASALVQQADGFTRQELPDSSIDQYSDQDLAALRNNETTVSDFLESQSSMEVPLSGQDYVNAEFKKLSERDYTLHRQLGYITLNQRLRADEALAVAMRLRTAEGPKTIGDFAEGGSVGGITSDRLVLKLVRPSNPTAPSEAQRPPAWFLEMRNIYRLRGRNFTQENFELDIFYEPSGQTNTQSIPGVTGNRDLLEVLGLDRIDNNGAPNPDDQFDFTPLTINQSEGLLIFPFLQPFGNRLLDAAEQSGNRSAGEEVAFPSLYASKKENAQERTERNVFHIRGESKGSTKQFYDLKAFSGLVEGSVEVTAGGQTLQEGVDYTVDYQGGTVTITNQSYLAAGREINISYEQNSFSNLQKKTLLGARANWSMGDKYELGATAMRLNQKSPIDKFRIGEEPIQNTIWGLDGSMNLQPQWLTRAVDALPLVQTKAQSAISLSGEFAQLRPGHSTTEAFERTRSNLQDIGEDFTADELGGISYIDDFEGFENTFSLRQQLSAWQVSAAPDSIADAPSLDEDVPGNEDDIERTYWRGTFGWYQLNENIRDKLDGRVAQRGNPAATEIFNVTDIFNRDTSGEVNTTLRTLDFYFNPWSRGPYNYTRDLEAFLNNPRRVWGGVTRRLPEGYTDFSLQNVEFVEFIVRVFPEEQEEVTDGAKLFVNLGRISEDVIPDQRLNDEDGMALDFRADDLGELARIATGTQEGNIDVRDRKTEDLGLDGLVSYNTEPYAEGASEASFWREKGFLPAVESTNCAATPRPNRCQAEVAQILDDPSGDDYHYFENDQYFGTGGANEFFPGGATLQQRFSRYHAGSELNGFQSQSELATNTSVARGISRSPDTEDLDRTGGNVNTTNDYYEYAIPLDRLDELSTVDRGPTDYVVSEIVKNGQDTEWYKIRIPVREFTDKVGQISDFTSIQAIRMWTTGHAAPVTMRLASLELVGSQWRTSPSVAQEPVEDGDLPSVGDGEVTVASINDEEDANYKAPTGAIVSQNRTARGAQQRSREQALLLNVSQLNPDEQRGVFKAFNQGLDLLKYSNLRMYTHVHGRDRTALSDNLKLFVRFGASETGDYYEYEQPVTATTPPTPDTPPQELWRDGNEVNVELSALNQLKVARDRSGEPIDSVFTSLQAGIDTNFDNDDSTPAPTLKVKGTPSLRTINTVVIGVRHQGPSTLPLDRFEVWVNELRVSGYDEKKGWAALTNANIELADLATVKGSFQRKTDGFGSLNSTLSERQQSDNQSWNVRTDLQLNKLLPEQQGWQIPVTLQMQSNTTTPRFDPKRGDVRLSEIQDQIENVDSLSAGEKSARKQDVVESAQTYNLRRSITANLSKQGSESWWLHNTLDATNLSFSYFDRSARSPQQQTDEQWNWSGSFEYQLDFGQPRTIDPFGFFGDLPVLGALSDLSFNYVPQSLSFSASAERNVQTQQNRSSLLRAANALPNRISNPVRERQQFDHRRRFSFQYNPFEFLNLSFDTNTRQNLNDVGSRTITNVLLVDEAGNLVTVADVDTAAFFDSPGQFVDTGDSTITSDDIGRGLFIEERLDVRSEREVAQNVIFGDDSPRTNQYQQRFTATLRPTLTDGEAFDWVDLQDVTYRSSFDWQNGAKGSITGATVSNSVEVRTGVNLHPSKVWSRFGFFEKWKQAEQEDRGGGRSRPQDRRGRDRGGQDAEDEGRGEDGDQSDGEDGGEDDDGGLGLSDLPLPDPVGILRSVALTFMDIRDISITYTGNRQSRATNVGRPVGADTTAQGVIVPEDVAVDYSLLDALRGQGPSFGYRFGLDRRIDPGSQRALLNQTQAEDIFSDGNRLEAQTTLSPSQSLQVDLNWDLQWQNQQNVTFRQVTGDNLRDDVLRTDDGLAFERTIDESGENQVSIWAFGSYEDMVQSQIDALQGSLGSSDTLDAGSVALTKVTAARDFREAFLSTPGSFGTQGFVPFPMPNWSVRYSGLSDWPLIRSITESMSLEHRYTSNYRSRYASVSSAGELRTLNIGGQNVSYRTPDFEISSAQVNEQFQPVVGMDVTWLGGLQTNVDWNQSVTTFFRPSEMSVEERTTSELTLRASFSKRGIDLPLLPIGKLNNRLRFSLTINRSVNDERSFNLRRALENAASQDFNFDPVQATQGENVSITRQTTRLTVTPELSYQFSNKVTGNFLLEYEKFESDGRQPSFTNFNGGFRVKVSLSEY
jgi:cell surface protein SprA